MLLALSTVAAEIVDAMLLLLPVLPLVMLSLLSLTVLFPEPAAVALELLVQEAVFAALAETTAVAETDASDNAAVVRARLSRLRCAL